MSIALMTEAWKTELPAGRKLILLSLCDNASDQGECYPSIASISQRCGLTERNIYRHLGVFEKCGAVTRENRTGRSNVYHIHPSKFAAIPAVDTPDIVSPTPDASVTPDIVSPLTPASPTPDIVSPPIPDASVTQNHHRTVNESVNTTHARKVGEFTSSIFCVDDVDPDVWSDFVKLRKAKKAPLTKTALDGIRAQAEKAGLSIDQALRMCCERGWSGFRAEWINSGPVRQPKTAAPPETFRERDARLAREKIAAVCPSVAAKPRATAQAVGPVFDAATGLLDVRH